MSWGNKLILAFVLFALFIGYMVYKSFNTQFDLVSKNYYNDELRYQDKIEAIKNANKLSGIAIEQKNNFIEINLPAELNNKNIKSDILFYCATDGSKDYKTSIKNTTQTIVELENLKNKFYTVKINITADTLQYYFEKKIEIKK